MTLALTIAAGCSAAVLLAFTLRRAVFLVAALLPPRRPGGAAVPTVALLVPAHDEAASVPLVLAALERLEYPPERLSVVLVDDGSSDGTGERFRAWAAGRPRAVALELPQRLGKFEALDRALAAVHGGGGDRRLRCGPASAPRLAAPARGAVRRRARRCDGGADLARERRPRARRALRGGRVLGPPADHVGGEGHPGAEPSCARGLRLPEDGARGCRRLRRRRSRR